MCNYFRLFAPALLAASLFGFSFGDTRGYSLASAVESGSQCTWTGASQVSASWFQAGNWTYSAGSIPQSNSSVIIAGGSKVPYLGKNTSIESLALSARLDFRNGAVLTVTGGWTSPGGALHGAGTVAGPGTISSGVLSASVTFNGDLTIQPGACLRVEASPNALVTAKGSLTNEGAIDSVGGDGTFSMQGAMFANRGSVDKLHFYFQREGEQHLAGTGTWGQGATIDISEKTALYLDNSLNVNVNAFTVRTGGAYYDDDGNYVTYGATLYTGVNTLTLTGPMFFRVGDYATVWGGDTGSVHVYGPLDLTDDRYGTFQAALRISKGADSIPNSAATTISGGLSDVTIDADAEADLTDEGGEVYGTGVNNLWVYGALKGVPYSGFSILGDGVIDGTVDTPGLINIASTIPQKITGKGSIHTKELVIAHTIGGDVTLAVPTKVDHGLLLQGELYAAGDGITLASGGEIEGGYDLWGTIQREGPFTFDQQYSMGGPGLYFIFSPAGSTATSPDAVTMTLTKGAPADFSTAVQRWYSFAVTGGTDWTATLSLRYLPAELNNNPEDKLQLWGRSGTAPWGLMGSSGASAQGAIEITGLTNLSDIAIASGQGIFLPCVWK